MVDIVGITNGIVSAVNGITPLGLAALAMVVALSAILVMKGGKSN
jgi:hypothetical protein